MSPAEGTADPDATGRPEMAAMARVAHDAVADLRRRVPGNTMESVKALARRPESSPQDTPRGSWKQAGSKAAAEYARAAKTPGHVAGTSVERAFER